MTARFFMGKLSSATISQRDNSPSNTASPSLPKRLVLLCFFHKQLRRSVFDLCALSLHMVLMMLCLKDPSVFRCRVFITGSALPTHSHADLTTVSSTLLPSRSLEKLNSGYPEAKSS